MAIGQLGGGGEDSPYEMQEELLGLESEDTSLPWLESEEDHAAPAHDNRRLIAIGLTVLVVIVALLGATWWFLHRNGNLGLAPDGSTIAAPQGDYKVKPKDPGGKVFAGTGDASYAVAEGESPDGRLAGENAPPPKISGPTFEPDTETGTPTAAAPPPAMIGVAVQVGAYSSQAGAERGWAQLGRDISVLDGIRYRIVEGQADIGRVYRLQAIVDDRAAANTLCGQIRAQGGACQVK